MIVISSSESLLMLIWSFLHMGLLSRLYQSSWPTVEWLSTEVEQICSNAVSKDTFINDSIDESLLPIMEGYQINNEPRYSHHHE